MGLSKSEIEVAVGNPGWQEFRVSLKGKSTQDKLKLLLQYYDDIYTQSGPATKDVQVLNYLNALSRGGQIARIEQVRGQNLRNLLAQNKIEVYR